ncbi:MAG: hypothetical protein ACNA70_04405 [Brevefilum sp.]
MRKHIYPLLITLMILAISLACSLPGLSRPTPTDEPQVLQEPTSTATEDAAQTPEPSETEEVLPTPEPTAIESEPTAEPQLSPDNAGQIAYIFNGNVWRYLIDSKQIVQVTTDGISGDHMNTYGKPGFSPDGRYLGFNKGNSSWILDLVQDTLINISPYGQFFTWTTEETQFFGVQGDFACPDIENLEDQNLINFDILRFDLNDLSNPTLLANIGGGLKFLANISGDGQWASIVHCACYSECGSENLWHLPSASVIAPPVSIQPGNIDFSPDNAQLTVSQHQMFGYFQSPLYVANVDYSSIVEILSFPGVAPVDSRWSPNGEWIAFTGIIIDEDEFTDVDRCVRLVRPDGSQEYVVECMFADFITWSPDGAQLLYSQTVAGQRQFYIYDLATSARTKLPFQAAPYTTLAWGRLQ